MANLLDRASVVLTPTAYNNGEALCIKPDDASGDFTFSRNSAATRVNAQGLVENVQILSSNLVQNGDFSEEGAELVTNGNDTSNIVGLADNQNITIQTSFLTIGKTYKIDFEIYDYVEGSIFLLRPNDLGVGSAVSANGTYTYTVVADASTSLIFRTDGLSTTLKLRNISVREVGQNWDFGTSWSISDGVAYFDDIANGNISQSKTFTSGKKYNISFEIKSGSGSIAFYSSNGVTNYVPFATYGVGTYSVVFDYTTGSGFGIFASKFLGGAFSITNISLIEITTDTNLPRINYEGFSYQDVLGSELVTNGDFATNINAWSGNTTKTWNNGTLVSVGVGAGNNTNFQSLNLTAGKTYRFTWEIASTDANASFVYLSTDGQITNSYVGAGTFTEDVRIVSNSIYVDFRFTGANTTTVFNSVSVKEVLGQEVVPDSGCGHWLWEPQTTQLLSYSEDFSQWNAGGDTTIESGYLAPDGTNNAYKISGTTSALTFGASLLTTTTRSIYARTVSGTGQAHLCSFNSNSNNLFTITEQWQRFEVNSATTTAAGFFYAVDFRNQTNLSEIILWGANATNDQDYATSYIPSNGSTVTRNQDVCTNGGSLASINSTSGVLYFETAALFSGSNAQISLSDGTNDNGVKLRFDLTSSRFTGFIKGNGGSTASKTVISSPQTDNNKFALVWNATNLRIWLNGVEAGTIATNDLPVGLDTLNFANNTGIANFFGKTKAVAVWKEALSDAELTELTTI